MQPRTTPPKDDLKAVIPVMRPVPGDGMRVVILSRHWVWLPTHYDGKRCVACADGKNCEWCTKQVRAWKGFVVCRGLNGQRRILVQITPNVVESICCELDEGQILTGLMVRLFRLGKERNSPLAATVLGRRNGEQEVSVQDTWTHVQRIFKLRSSVLVLSNGTTGAPSFVFQPGKPT